MQRVSRYAFVLLASVCLMANAQARTLGGVTLPDSYPVAGRTLTLNGMGVRNFSFLGIRIYVAGLYLTQPNHDAKAILASPEPKVGLLQLLHAGSKAEVEKEYREGERLNCGDGGCPPTDQTDFERMVAAAPAVAVGDTSTYVFTETGFQVLSNNKVIGVYANKDLAFRMLSGFIGARPPTPELRNGLHGLSN